MKDKKLIGTLIELVLCLSFLVSCAGAQDWTYYLPNSYSIVRSNARSIKLIGAAGQVVEPQIVKFQYDDQYVGVCRVSVDEHEAYLDGEFVNKEWILVDMESADVLGQFSDEQEYDDALRKMGATTLCEWMSTVPRPEGADYLKMQRQGTAEQ